MSRIISVFTAVYRDKDIYTRKKAEYSIILICISIAAMFIIMALETVLVEPTVFKLISSLLFVLAFFGILLLIKAGFFELAINLLAIGSLVRCLMIYNYPTPFQFYIMTFLSMLTIAIVYTKIYQVIALNSAMMFLLIYKVPVMYQLVQTNQVHERAFTQSLYSVVIMVAVMLMLWFLVQIINREIEEQEILLNMAHTDPLTGLCNRRRILEQFTAMSHEEDGLSVIIFDIDYFKEVNDTYGHLVGDFVLKGIADTLNNLEGNLQIARWGGEEFLILTPTCNKKTAVLEAEKIRRAIEKTVYEKNIQITVSLGVSIYKDKEEMTETIKRADEALYISKEEGRNRVTFI